MSYLRITTIGTDGDEHQVVIEHELTAEEAFTRRLEIAEDSERPFEFDETQRSIHFHPLPGSGWTTHQYLEYAENYEEFPV